MIDTSPTPFDNTPKDIKQIIEDSRKNKVERYNEQLARCMMDDPNCTHLTQLHPTKGYRTKNIKIMLSSMNKQQMWNTFWGVITRAREAQKTKVNSNG